MSAPAAFAASGVLALREHRDAHGLAGAVRHHGRAAHLLVGLAGIDAEVHGDVHRLVELRGGEFLDELQRLVDRVTLAREEASPSRSWCVSLRLPCHTPSTSTPMLRALPAMVRTAASRSAAVRSGIFSLGDVLELLARDLADLRGVRRARCPSGCRAPCAISTDAGGVFMMNVKLRSLYTVITTGVGRPFSSCWVCALNCLAELHDVHALLAERRTDRRARVRLACRDLQLDVAGTFFAIVIAPVGASASLTGSSPGSSARAPAFDGVAATPSDNYQAFSTCEKSSSTGVERPRICTATCSRFFS